MKNGSGKVVAFAAIVGIVVGCAGSEDEAFSAPYRTTTGLGSRCGNGILERGEMCDGDDLGGETCQSATMSAASRGTLGCNLACVLDTSQCSDGRNPGGGTTGGGGTNNGGGTTGNAGTFGFGGGN